MLLPSERPAQALHRQWSRAIGMGTRANLLDHRLEPELKEAGTGSDYGTYQRASKKLSFTSFGFSPGESRIVYEAAGFAAE